jgi:hypothetical protein
MPLPHRVCRLMLLIEIVTGDRRTPSRDLLEIATVEGFISRRPASDRPHPYEDAAVRESISPLSGAFTILFRSRHLAHRKIVARKPRADVNRSRRRV